MTKLRELFFRLYYSVSAEKKRSRFSLVVKKISKLSRCNFKDQLTNFAHFLRHSSSAQPKIFGSAASEESRKFHSTSTGYIQFTHKSEIHEINTGIGPDRENRKMMRII